MLSNRRNITLVLCGLTLATSLAILAARAQSNAPQAAPKLAEEEYKNIQALKGVPADQIFPSMQFITASLGVECDYCHVREGQKMVFDKDDKKTKVTARKMMQMMIAINKENFEGHREVTCYSCHRGAADPVGMPISHTPNGDSITAFDGKQGWLGNPGRPAHMMTAAENDAVRIDSDLYFPSHVKTLYAKFIVAPGEKIDGHDTWLVVGRNEGQPPLRLYLDQQTGLLVRLVRYAETALGRMPTQIDYADYRDADGVKIPYRWTLARPGGNRFTIQVDQVQQNVAVDDAKFAAPPPPPPPDKKPAGL